MTRLLERNPDARAARPPSAAEGEDAFLAELGGRVRALRARRGMSRRTLADASGGSERYLAARESGRGNVSVLLLRQIAAALSLPDTPNTPHSSRSLSSSMGLVVSMVAGAHIVRLAI